MFKLRRYCRKSAICQWRPDYAGCKKNITIAQPRPAPSKPNRDKAWKAKGYNDADITETTIGNQESVLNKHFSSGGYGAPQSKNRKQTTLTKNKDSISSINGEWTQGSSYALGYMSREQSRLESNVGSLDRIARLKAKAVANSK